MATEPLPEVTGTPGASRPGPCGTGGLPPLGEPRQRHWHLAWRRDTTAMTAAPGRHPRQRSAGLAGRARCGHGLPGWIVRELSPTTAGYEVLRAAPRHHASSGRSLAGGVTARGPAAPPQPGGEQPSGQLRPWPGGRRQGMPAAVQSRSAEREHVAWQLASGRTVRTRRWLLPLTGRRPGPAGRPTGSSQTADRFPDGHAGLASWGRNAIGMTGAAVAGGWADRGTPETAFQQVPNARLDA